MIECTPQELLPIMPPSVQRSWVAGSGRSEVMLFGGGAERIEDDSGLDAGDAAGGVDSRMRAMYFEKSRMTAALQHCPANAVPAPRASNGAR